MHTQPLVKNGVRPIASSYVPADGVWGDRGSHGSHSSHGSSLHIYGSIGLTGRLRNVPFKARFLVCRISDNAILGMEFLSRHDCSVTCDKGLLVIGGKSIQCTDRMGRLLANKVQVTRTLTLAPDREVHISCQLNSEPSGPIGLIESLLSEDSGVVVAATLNRPWMKRATVQCMNLDTEPRELKAETIIGISNPLKRTRLRPQECKPRVYCQEPVKTT